MSTDGIIEHIVPFQTRPTRLQRDILANGMGVEGIAKGGNLSEEVVLAHHELLALLERVGCFFGGMGGNGALNDFDGELRTLDVDGLTSRFGKVIVNVPTTVIYRKGFCQIAVCQFLGPVIGFRTVLEVPALPTCRRSHGSPVRIRRGDP